MMTWLHGRLALAAVAALALSVPAMAQAPDASRSELLQDFIHYTMTARTDLAADTARALIATGISDAELAQLVVDDPTTLERFEAALARGHRVSELQDIAADLDRRLHDGRLALARDRTRVEEAIGWLTGTQRQKMLADDLLMEAGEYAVPYLLPAVLAAEKEQLREAAIRMLVRIGRQAVTPLSVSLGGLDPDNQRLMCGVLGEIGLPHAAPYLLEVANDANLPPATREAADRAFRRAGGVNGGVSAAFARLAKQYFNESESVIAFPMEATNNVWTYDPMSGLDATPVPTAIFSEVMAMKTASRSLRADPGNQDALAHFVAANLRRANELPNGEADPIYGNNRYTPEFYATVFGTSVCMDVLGLALDRLDTALVRDAILALSGTTGGGNLFGSSGSGRQPLLEALQYPNRRVQYEAALTLARALPGQRFAGDVRVVPLLASAVRSSSESYAVIIARDDEDRRLRAAWLEEIGFTVVASSADARAASDQLMDAVGVDLVVVNAGTNAEATDAVAHLRVTPKTSAAPILVVVGNLDLARLHNEFRDDVHVKVARARATQEGFSEAVDEVVEQATGGRMTEAESEAYAIDSIMALRDIALSGSAAYVIEDAESALLGALQTRSGGVRLMVAEVLSMIDSVKAQRALFDAALAAQGDEQVDLLDTVAGSVRRFGDRAEPRHVAALIDLVASSSGATADAAARVSGALNLPGETAIKLIPQ